MAVASGPLHRMDYNSILGNCCAYAPAIWHLGPADGFYLPLRLSWNIDSNDVPRTCWSTVRSHRIRKIYYASLRCWRFFPDYRHIIDSLFASALHGSQVDRFTLSRRRIIDVICTSQPILGRRYAQQSTCWNNPHGLSDSRGILRLSINQQT